MKLNDLDLMVQNVSWRTVAYQLWNTGSCTTNQIKQCWALSALGRETVVFSVAANP